MELFCRDHEIDLLQASPQTPRAAPRLLRGGDVDLLEQEVEQGPSAAASMLAMTAFSFTSSVAQAEETMSMFEGSVLIEPTQGIDGRGDRRQDERLLLVLGEGRVLSRISCCILFSRTMASAMKPIDTPAPMMAIGITDERHDRQPDVADHQRQPERHRGRGQLRVERRSPAAAPRSALSAG